MDAMPDSKAAHGVPAEHDHNSLAFRRVCCAGWGEEGEHEGEDAGLGAFSLSL